MFFLEKQKQDVLLQLCRLKITAVLDVFFAMAFTKRGSL